MPLLASYSFHFHNRCTTFAPYHATSHLAGNSLFLPQIQTPPPPAPGILRCSSLVVCNNFTKNLGIPSPTIATILDKLFRIKLCFRFLFQYFYFSLLHNQFHSFNHCFVNTNMTKLQILIHSIQASFTLASVIKSTLNSNTMTGLPRNW